ncbi:MAG: hypothetical protein ACXU99_12510 [Thermodesulfobacteriota bacterium]
MSINLLVKKLIHDRNIDPKIFLCYTNKSNEDPHPLPLKRLCRNVIARE